LWERRKQNAGNAGKEKPQAERKDRRGKTGLEVRIGTRVWQSRSGAEMTGQPFSTREVSAKDKEPIGGAK